jgi:uncharacterized repeat protein (TIGR03837 family)
MTMPGTWDIICRVVDNYGDAGVCWRLARRLAQKDAAVRLWIDDLATLERLHPRVTDAGIQCVEAIEIRALRDELLATTPAQVVIEAFGCGLPQAHAFSMASARPASLWIVLEYLSAESWVPAHHGLPSPHPRLDLPRYFFFPGFAEGTGGVLREPDLLARRDAFGIAGQRTFWTSCGHRMPPEDATTISLFGYETAPVAALLDAWERSPSPIVAAVPEGRLLPAVLAHFGLSTTSSTERVIRRGTLEVRIMPFVPQARYDELLWSCDVNFVRGEDSFVRAQWAGRPFVWQIYPQEDGSHWPKLEAFIDRYGEAATVEVRQAANALMTGWNGANASNIASAWRAFHAHREALARHTRAWADRLAALGDLADNLARFAEDKLK